MSEIGQDQGQGGTDEVRRDEGPGRVRSRDSARRQAAGGDAGARSKAPAGQALPGDGEAMPPPPAAPPGPAAARGGPSPRRSRTAPAAPRPQPNMPGLEAGEAPATPEETPASGHTAHELLWRTGILNAGTIARRELAAYLVSPIGYVFATVLIIPVSLFSFISPLSAQTPINMADAYGLVIYLMVFLMPLATMRLLAEERRTGTLEVLLTTPARDWEVVAGKWLGAYGYFLLVTLFLGVYVLLLAHFAAAQTVVVVLGSHFEVANLEYGSMLTGYLGVLAVGAAFAAIGLLGSSVTHNQVVAAAVALGILVFLVYMVGFLSSFLIQPYADLLDYVSVYNRYQSFMRGQLALQDAVYFASVTLAALFLTVRVLESRKWR